MFENKVRLLEIFNEISNLLNEAKDLFRQELSKRDFQNIKYTWFGRISASLGGGDFVEDYETFKKDVHNLFTKKCCEDMILVQDTIGEYKCKHCHQIYNEDDGEDDNNDEDYQDEIEND